MPGVAEPDIAIDIVASASGLTEVMDIGNNSSTSRPRLAARTLRLIGLDAAGDRDYRVRRASRCFTRSDSSRRPRW